MTRTIYVATAANTYFWQKLAVRAHTHDEAYEAFKRYLAAPANQKGEEYEYDSGQAIKDEVSEPCDRAQYVYSVDWQGVEPDWDRKLNQRTPRKGVTMIDSGGNG